MQIQCTNRGLTVDILCCAVWCVGEVCEERLISYLFTLGEIAQLCPDKTPKRVFMLVESLVAAPVITSIGKHSMGVSH